jgi:glycosyltransferase involved in cell wall biosynthesis
MNILHIIDSAGIYGAEVMLLNLMEAQKKMGLHPALLSMGHVSIGQKSVEIESMKRGLNTKTLRFRNKLNILNALKILQIANSLDVQVVHSHGYKGNILLGLLPRRFRSIPVITTLHGWTATRLLSKISIYEFIDALAIKNLECVVGVSASISSKRIIKYFGINPFIINNGIKQLNFEKGVLKATFPALASNLIDTYSILAIGRLSSEKGFDILIRSISHLVSEKIPVNLVIIGDGENRSRLDRIIEELGLEEIVHLIGYQQEAHRFMADFDAFVLPSLTEGLPITILEAMQAGIPIIATRVGEIPTLLDDGELGELVIPNDVEDLSRALKRVYKNRQQAKEKSKKAKQNILINYGLEKMAKQYNDLYKKITNKDK